MVSAMDAGELGLGEAILELVAPGGGSLASMPLVPSAARECARLDALRATSAEALFGGSEVRSPEDASCVRSGLFLYFGALDESHRISQGIGTASGSYWHGIMHRQEGDWSNSKYWFRRTGDHPVFADLGREAGRSWDPFEFVDRCAAASSGRLDESPLIDLQMVEWRALMRHCYRRALTG